ncbi:carbon monoxide dehydrogenase [Paraburkholderia sp. NMBU_R16]|uniref:CoxG family protein n=1 Tax=Paraburkholderia sp. NMBU_R16 TaxID=2698676 RepID=UPI001567AB47|nr:carbon monoxide dehydrogenase subunit G [Paraburkholderia sp. NMBU_R16]NRO96250.1 carbon monoxide dehydrogenase [Paraburkholderia sp. NMBU_R16]
MELTEQYLLPVSREHAWEALRDTAVLRTIIPGCESIEADGENAYTVSMLAAVGPVKAHFKGRMSLTDIDPPNSYTVVFEGQGGVAGFAKGSAAVTLEADGESSTKLSYTAHAQVGGKLAQIGSRLVDGAARKVAGEFFKRFTAQMTGETGAGAESTDEGAAPAQAGEAAEQAPAGKGHKSWKAWISKS